MDIMTLITLLVGFIAIIGSNIGLFLWNRGEARADSRRALEIIEAINNEMKDFHGRLCSIEAQRRGISLEEIKEN